MRRRKKSRVGLVLLILLALILIAVLMLKFVFVVRNVELEGSYSGDTTEIIRTARIDFGASVFRIDEDAIRDNLEGTGLYRLESVRSQLPNTIVLEIYERERAAMLLHAGKILVMDADGCVIEALPETPDMDLVYVSGAEASNYRIGKTINMTSARLQAYTAVMQALRNNSAQYYVSELKLDDAENLVIISRTGITVKLGDAGNMDQKIAWMKSAVADLESRGEYGGTLDVSSGTKADYRRAQ